VRYVVTALLVASAVVAAAASTPAHGKSDNWTGYAVTGTHFKRVSGSWVQPAANCFGRAAGSTAASFWVGLGGDLEGSGKVEQIGTDSDCDAAGQPYYYAWYELWPRDGVTLGLDVEPGDRISVSVSIVGRSGVRLELRNLTSGRRFVRTLHIGRPDGTSAEWIAEAPSQTVRQRDEILPLTDFGTIRFSSALATSTTGHTGAISDPSWRAEAIDFRSDGANPHNPVATFVDGVSAAFGGPTVLGRGGRSFAITWRNGRPPAGHAAPGAA
jgi:hypothetical protein